MGCDSAVGIATGYALDGPGIESRWGRDIPQPSIPPLEPIQPPAQWVPDLFPGATYPHLAPRLMKEYSYTSTSGSSWPVTGWTLPLSFPRRRRRRKILDTPLWNRNPTHSVRHLSRYLAIPSLLSRVCWIGLDTAAKNVITYESIVFRRLIYKACSSNSYPRIGISLWCNTGIIHFKLYSRFSAFVLHTFLFSFPVSIVLVCLAKMDRQ